MADDFQTKKTLDDFLDFMKPNRYGSGWTMTSNTGDHAVFEKTYPATSGSCLIAFLLLCLGLVPGILYIIFTRKPARTVKLSVKVMPDGTLHPSGDTEGIQKFERFITSTKKKGDNSMGNDNVSGGKKFLSTRAGKWVIGIGVFFVLAIIGAVASPSNENSNTQQQTTNTSNQLTAEQIAAQEAADRAKNGDPSKPHFSDGDHVVGTDIQPGTYRTRIGSSGCYFARLKGFGGTLDEIIANENTSNPVVITIAATDKGFKSSNCATWTQDLSSITTSKTSFEDGVYIVGTDMEPGTYKNTGGSCYYARLRGFSETLDDIITNENTSTPAIVTIAASDKGFKSSGCGTWTKQ